MKKQPLIPKGGNDRVYTPPKLACEIVDHFWPMGSTCDPCRGKGAFYDALRDNMPCVESTDWFELDEGQDFLTAEGHWDWIITNPPWSKMTDFMGKAFTCADNVVFLMLTNAVFQKARMRLLEEHDMGIKEILFVPQPPKPWPSSGMSLSATHFQRDWKGTVTLSQL